MSEKDQSSSGRRVQFEMFFTLPDFSDISLRDYQETMQRPFFSLSKKKRLKPIEYLSPDKSVTVHVSANPAYGMATIWDADIMIYLASHLNELRERGQSVGLATVYRTLQRLAETGDVDMLRSEDGEAIWRQCSETHHHHLVCRECGSTVEVEGPAVERWADSIAAEHGFADVSHTLEIFGTCPSCR